MPTGLGNDLDFKDMSHSVNKNAQFFKVMMRCARRTPVLSTACCESSRGFGMADPHRYMRLRDAALREVDAVRGTNWEGADLSNASLFGSFAKGANFRSANLTGADLESVDFDGADLTGAQLAGAQVPSKP